MLCTYTFSVIDSKLEWGVACDMVRLTYIRGMTQQYVAEAYRVIACLW